MRHTLDIMHVEKNACENLLRTIVGEKDSPAVRHDMKEINIHPDLWMRQVRTRTGRLKWVKPHAPYVLSKAELQVFMDTISKLKVPTGYSSTFKKHIVSGNFGSLKSHDFHVLLQTVIPLAVRGLLHPAVRAAIMRLGTMFRYLTAKVVNPGNIQWLREFTIETLCIMEVWLPPAFWDIMSHVLVHLVDELQWCGPVACRWMYPLERYMAVLKGFVHNRAQPEGSMAAGYSCAEALGFVTSHMRDFSHHTTRVWDDEEESFMTSEELEGIGTRKILTPMEMKLAHNFVITNSVDTAEYLG